MKQVLPEPSLEACLRLHLTQAETAETGFMGTRNRNGAIAE